MTVIDRAYFRMTDLYRYSKHLEMFRALKPIKPEKQVKSINLTTIKNYNVVFKRLCFC